MGFVSAPQSFPFLVVKKGKPAVCGDKLQKVMEVWALHDLISYISKRAGVVGRERGPLAVFLAA